MNGARWILLSAFAVILGGCADSLNTSRAGKTVVQNAECHGLRPEKWLAGGWGAQNTRVTIQASDGTFTWEYTRDPGATSERWGLKEPAKAYGTVSRINGCEIDLDGHYTAYGGTPRAVGSPMTYRMKYDGSRILAGTGLGWGRETFQVRWSKRPE